MSIRVVTTSLRGSSLAQAVIDGSAPTPWFTMKPRNPAEWKARADLVRGALTTPRWLDVLGPAFSASGLAANRLERASSNGFAVTTGQQPGLFGGPLYTWWKALSALALADRLERETGLPVVPIFWAATDDADFAEAASTVVTIGEATTRIRTDASGDEGLPLARRPLGDVSSQIAQLAAAAGSASNPSGLDKIRQAYKPGETVGGAYVSLMRSMLEPLGIAVLDAAHSATRTAGFPILCQALNAAEGVERALAERSAELKAAGHQVQVKPVKGRTLVFAETERKRDRIATRDAGTVAASARPGELGPNVLLRPIVERTILPTVAYVGGPAEIAYFAQVSAVADALQTTVPLVLPRWSGFLVEPRVDRILERYRLDVEDLRDPHSVESRLAREAIPGEVREAIERLRESTSKALTDLSRSAGSDIVASSVLEGLNRNVARRIERLERRFAAAVKRRGSETLRDIAVARASLFPENAPQERSLNIIPFLARHGDELIDKVLREAESHAARLA